MWNAERAELTWSCVLLLGIDPNHSHRVSVNYQLKLPKMKYELSKASLRPACRCLHTEIFCMGYKLSALKFRITFLPYLLFSNAEWDKTGG